MWYLANPAALFLFVLPFFAALYFLFRRRSSKKTFLLPLAGHRTLLRQKARLTKLFFRVFFAGSLLSLAVFVFCVARPTVVTAWVEKWSEGIDIVFVVDLSESMDATDIEPNRMVASKSVIRDFIRRRKEDRIGLITFGGDAVTRCPLTRDYDFLVNTVNDLHSGELKQGTAIGMGLANAVSRLRSSHAKSRIIILLTDGDSNVGAINPITSSHLAHQDGIRIYTIGLGKDLRVLVPIFSRDAYGRKHQVVAQVPSYINPELLKNISRITGGNAYLARDAGMLNRVLRDIDSLERTKVKSTPREKKDEWFFWPGALATLFLFGLCLLQETRFRRARYAPS